MSGCRNRLITVAAKSAFQPKTRHSTCAERIGGQRHNGHWHLANPPAANAKRETNNTLALRNDPDRYSGWQHAGSNPLGCCRRCLGLLTAKLCQEFLQKRYGSCSTLVVVAILGPDGANPLLH